MGSLSLTQPGTHAGLTPAHESNEESLFWDRSHPLFLLHLCQVHSELSNPKDLTHEATKAVKGSGNPSLGVHFNQHILLCMDINLQQASSVQGTVHEHQ